MAAPAPASHCVTLAGSAELVAEFFAYSVNTLLYQRGVYAPETFTRVSKYGMTMLVSSDAAVTAYLRSVLAQMTRWLAARELDRVVVVFASVATGAVLERWAFNVRCEDEEGGEGSQGGACNAGVGGGANENAGAGNVQAGSDKSPEDKAPKAAKEEKKIMAEIQAVVRQITASVTFLPLLDEPCSFDMLIYTKKDTETPAAWEESGARIIPRNTEVQLRSFSTSVHNVDACVTFARDEE